MDITFYCPSCAKKYKVPESMAGAKAPCKACGEQLKVPPESELAPPEFLKPVKKKDAHASSSHGHRTPSRVHHGEPREKPSKPEDRPRKRIEIPGEVDVGEYHLKEELEPWSHERMKQGGACPDCGAGAKAKQVMCMQCGLNFKTGAKVPPMAKKVEVEPPVKRRFWPFG